MLAVFDANDAQMNRSIPYLCLLLLAGPAHIAELLAVPAETTDPEQARAKLAELHDRIAALTTRLGGQLEERDALAARLREAELTITAKRRQLENLRSAQAAAERRRVELRVEKSRNQSALDAERSALGAQVRAAYMIGQQEQIKLLLNHD